MDTPAAPGTDGSRSERFVQLFNRLDHHLARLTKQSDATPFAEKLSLASPLHTAVAEKLVELREFGRLRNFIVHEQGHVLTSWAEPTDEALAYFRALVESIVAPEPLLPRFQRSLQIFPLAEPLVRALEHMRDNDYSQVVVQARRRYGLLSVEGIARWVAHSYTDDCLNVRQATVGAALGFEPGWTVAYLPETGTVEDARQILLHHRGPDQRRVFVVLLTPTGAASERPLGIVTPWDL